jgi:hypothetical protein
MQKTNPVARIAVHAPRQKAEDAEDGEEETDFIFDPPRFDPPRISRELYTTFAVLPRDVTLLEVVKLFSQVREAPSTAGRE